MASGARRLSGPNALWLEWCGFSRPEGREQHTQADIPQKEKNERHPSHSAFCAWKRTQESDSVDAKKTLKRYRPRILIEGARFPPFGFPTTEINSNAIQNVSFQIFIQIHYFDISIQMCNRMVKSHMTQAPQNLRM